MTRSLSPPFGRILGQVSVSPCPAPFPCEAPGRGQAHFHASLAKLRVAFTQLLDEGRVYLYLDYRFCAAPENPQSAA